MTLEKLNEFVKKSINNLSEGYYGSNDEMPEEEEKRYAVQCSMYLYAHNDEEAIKIANIAAKGMEKTSGQDGWASVDSLYEVPFGTIGKSRKVNIK